MYNATDVWSTCPIKIRFLKCNVLMNTCKTNKLNKNKGITTGNYGTYL